MSSQNQPSDERMAEVVNSRIRTGLKGVCYVGDENAPACWHPHCSNEAAPRLQRPEGWYDDLCWRHRLKRVAWGAIKNTVIVAFPSALLASIYPRAGLVMFVVGWLFLVAVDLLVDEP